MSTWMLLPAPIEHGVAVHALALHCDAAGLVPKSITMLPSVPPPVFAIVIGIDGICPTGTMSKSSRFGDTESIGGEIVDAHVTSDIAPITPLASVTNSVAIVGFAPGVHWMPSEYGGITDWLP